MQTAQNKQQELKHLQSFCELYGDCPPLESLISVDGEKPDFRFQLDGRILGIEHTRLYRPIGVGRMTPGQAQESIWDAIHDRARGEWDALGGRPISVKVFPSLPVELKKSDTPRLVDDLVRLLVNRRVDLLPDYEELLIDEGLPQEFSSIKVYAHPAGMDVWNCTKSSFGYEWTEDDIQSTIDDKNGKVDGYRQRCDELWLLITYDFGPLASWGDLTDEVRSKPFVSRFDRTLMHNFNGGSVVGRSVVELHPQR